MPRAGPLGPAGIPGRVVRVLGIWRGWTDKVRGPALECGHYLLEEAPEETHSELRAFFGAGQEASL